VIFVTVGSQKFQFNRLLRAIDKLVEKGDIQEEVFAQSGACDYAPKYYSSQPFLDRDDFSKEIDQCDLVITHGGTGAIVGALKEGKKVIAVPRLAKYGEHVDDHQCQLIEQFTKANLISGCENIEQLGSIIKEIREREFNQYVSNTKLYLNTIDNYIKSL